MVRALVRKFTKKQVWETKSEFILRRKMIEEQIKENIRTVIICAISCIIGALVFVYFFAQPVEGHWEPVYDDNGVVINTVWVEH